MTWIIHVYTDVQGEHVATFMLEGGRKNLPIRIKKIFGDYFIYLPKTYHQYYKKTRYIKLHRVEGEVILHYKSGKEIIKPGYGHYFNQDQARDIIKRWEKNYD